MFINLKFQQKNCSLPRAFRTGFSPWTRVLDQSGIPCKALFTAHEISFEEL